MATSAPKTLVDQIVEQEPLTVSFVHDLVKATTESADNREHITDYLTHRFKLFFMPEDQEYSSEDTNWKPDFIVDLTRRLNNFEKDAWVKDVIVGGAIQGLEASFIDEKRSRQNNQNNVEFLGMIFQYLDLASTGPSGIFSDVWNQHLSEFLPRVMPFKKDGPDFHVHTAPLDIQFSTELLCQAYKTLKTPQRKHALDTYLEHVATYRIDGMDTVPRDEILRTPAVDIYKTKLEKASGLYSSLPEGTRSSRLVEEYMDKQLQPLLNDNAFDGHKEPVLVKLRDIYRNVYQVPALATAVDNLLAKKIASHVDELTQSQSLHVAMGRLTDLSNKLNSTLRSNGTSLPDSKYYQVLTARARGIKLQLAGFTHVTEQSPVVAAIRSAMEKTQG